jgi:hypothetical protein
MRADLHFELCGKLVGHAPRNARPLEAAIQSAPVGATLNMIPDGPMNGGRECFHGARGVELIACKHIA